MRRNGEKERAEQPIADHDDATPATALGDHRRARHGDRRPGHGGAGVCGSRSPNGWRASANPVAIGIATSTVPGSYVQLTVKREVVARILVEVAGAVNRTSNLHICLSAVLQVSRR
jgi:hypothetical protein